MRVSPADCNSRAFNEEIAMMDSQTDALDARIEDLERALTDRRFRRHLIRQIRRGQRFYAWAGSWRAARTEVTTWQWDNRTGSVPAELPEQLPPAPGGAR